MTTLDSMYVASYLRAIGDAVNAVYGAQTGAWLSDYEDELADANVTADQVSYSEATVETKVVDYGAICITGWGVDSNGDVVGHSWIIDGMNVLIVHDVTRIYNALNILISETSTPRSSNYNLFHCNFGWEGDCDGYYSYSAFNLDVGPVNGYDESIGDQWDTDLRYDRNLLMLNYNLQ